MCEYKLYIMTRRKPKLVTLEEEVETVEEMPNDLNTITKVPETVPEPTEVKNNDVLLPRSASRYVPPLR